MKVNVGIEVIPPTLPDRLKVQGSKRAGLLVGELDDDQLRAIAQTSMDLWLKRAKLLRSQSTESTTKAKA